MNMIELGWLVGIIEGEGSIMLTYPKDRAFRITISVEMTDEDVINKLHQITGVGKITSNNRNNPKWKPTWSWRVQAKSDVLDIANLIKPYMGLRRTEQIEKVLTACCQT